MLLGADRLRHHPTAFKAMTGLTPHEFDTLVEDLWVPYRTAERARRERPNRKHAIGAGHPFALPPKSNCCSPWSGRAWPGRWRCWATSSAWTAALVVVPRYKPHAQPQPPQDVAYNRSVVEHTIRRIRLYAALSHPDRPHRRQQHAARMWAVGGLVNRQFDHRFAA